MRWRVAILVSIAIAISYLDRQTLPVAVQSISRDIPLSNSQFSALQSAFLFSYALMYAGGGKLVDVLGTTRGFTLIMLFWSFACAGHALASSFMLLADSRASSMTTRWVEGPSIMRDSSWTAMSGGAVGSGAPR